MNKENHEKLSKIVYIIMFIYVGLFIIVQGTVMIFAMFEVVDSSAFLTEVNALVAFLMACVNSFALVGYCRNAGSPYLNEMNKTYVRKFKLVIIVWNLAFLFKFAMSSFGVNIVTIDEQAQDASNFWFSVETFANILFSEIIPFYVVLDKQIV